MSLPLRSFLCTIAMMLALPLTSCMRWHTTDRLRDTLTTYTGADIYHPVDGMIHSGIDDEGEKTHYVLAPEVAYKHRSPIINSDGFNYYHEPPYAKELRPTGRTLVVEMENYCFKRVVPRLPQGVKAEAVPPPEKRNFWNMPGWRAADTHAYALGELACQQEQPSTARRVLIGTCDYVVDPMLNLITFPVEVSCWIVGTPIAAGISGVMSLIPNDNEKAEVTPDN